MAANQIELLPGFVSSSSFVAYIDDDLCNYSFGMEGIAPPAEVQSKSLSVNNTDNDSEIEELHKRSPYFLEMTVYPNPSSNGKFILNIETDTESLAPINFYVYNTLGQLKIEKQNTGRVEYINLTDQNKGIYILQVKIGEEMFTTKLIIN